MMGKVDIASIPDFRKEELARCVLTSLEKAMAQPGAEEEFQAWLAAYKKKQPPKSGIEPR